MFLYFFAFFCLLEENNAADQKIVECSMDVNGKARPTVPPENCHDLDSTACSSLFPKVEQNTHTENADVYVQLLTSKFCILSDLIIII